MNKKKLIELRCKAWGITEDEYYCNQCSDFSLEDMARAYRRGKNKGARDKAIQNVGFYQKQMQDIYDKKNKQIADLEKENADLKEEINKIAFARGNLEEENAELKHINSVTLSQLNLDNGELITELTYAKEIISECLPALKRGSWWELHDKAEAFLKEMEK